MYFRLEALTAFSARCTPLQSGGPRLCDSEGYVRRRRPTSPRGWTRASHWIPRLALSRLGAGDLI